MKKIAFAGFRHEHIYGAYKRACSDPDIRVAAVYEADENAKRKAAKDIGAVFTHDDYKDILAQKDIDIVAIGDYYGIRGQMAIAALKAGKHVYLDKPICTSLAELDEIEKISGRKNLKVGEMLDLRFNAVINEARRIITSGKLGSIHAVFFSGQHRLMYGTRPAWYFEEGKHGGTINDIAIHGVDAVDYMTGLSLKRVVSARCWNAFAREAPLFKDCAQFMAELSNGAGLMGDVSYSAPNSLGSSLPSYWRFTIWGDKGIVEFNLGSKEILMALDGNSQIEFIKVPDIRTGDSLGTFIDEVNGKEVIIDTASVIKSSRNTLLIQEAADR